MIKKIFLLTLFIASNCFAKPNRDLQYFYWNPLGSLLFSESMVKSPINYVQPSFSLLLGQNEPLSFILRNNNDSDIKIKSISIVNLVQSDNLVYDIRVVKNWYMGSQTGISVTKQGLANPKLTPELLLKNDSLIMIDNKTQKNYLNNLQDGLESYLDISSPTELMSNNAIVNDTKDLKPFIIKPNQGKQIWLNLTTNQLTKIKSYNIKLKIEYFIGSQKRYLFVPFNFEVLPLQLSNDKLNHSVYYSGQLRGINRLLSTPKTESQYIAELKNLKSHGVLYPTQYLFGDNESVIAQYVRIRNKLGFPCDKMYFIGGIGDTHVHVLSILESNIRLLKNIVSTNSDCKNAQIYLYGIDEASGSTLLSESKEWKAVTDNGAFVFAASFKGDLYENNMLTNLQTLVSLPLYNQTKQDKLQMRTLGKDVYLYGEPQSGIANPFLYRKNYGYYLIKNDYTGAMPFAYQFGFPEHQHSSELSGGLCFTSQTAYCSVWNNFDDRVYYDHMFTYPTSNGVIDTIQWEGYASAITDVRYYYTLLDLMSRKCTQDNIICNFDPKLLIDVGDPVGTRQRIIDKIKLILTLNNQIMK